MIDVDFLLGLYRSTGACLFISWLAALLSVMAPTWLRIVLVVVGYAFSYRTPFMYPVALIVTRIWAENTASCTVHLASSAVALTTARIVSKPLVCKGFAAVLQRVFVAWLGTISSDPMIPISDDSTLLQTLYYNASKVQRIMILPVLFCLFNFLRVHAALFVTGVVDSIPRLGTLGMLGLLALPFTSSIIADFKYYVTLVATVFFIIVGRAGVMAFTEDPHLALIRRQKKLKPYISGKYLDIQHFIRPILLGALFVAVDIDDGSWAPRQIGSLVSWFTGLIRERVF